jgi:NAD(P)-dependent dehydrogenase (short-subunit alcohol dehydrogenase family)
MGVEQLKDATVVIIGGSAGIGIATASACLTYGAKVVIGGRSQDRLQEAVTKLDGDVETVVVDINDSSSIQALFAGLDQVDHVFMNAGMAKGGSILESELSILEASINDRIWGPIHVARYAMPKMNDKSSLTLMSGLWGTIPNDITSVGLAGREMLTKILAREMAPIRVNAIAPGPIQTGNYPPEAVEYIGSQMLVKRVGTPEETADAVISLMMNGFITGEVLHIDGGARLLYKFP